MDGNSTAIQKIAKEYKSATDATKELDDSIV